MFVSISVGRVPRGNAIVLLIPSLSLSPRRCANIPRKKEKETTNAVAALPTDSEMAIRNLFSYCVFVGSRDLVETIRAPTTPLSGDAEVVKLPALGLTVLSESLDIGVIVEIRLTLS